MERLNELLERIIQRVNVNLREPLFDVGPYVRGLVPWQQLVKFYAFYGITPHHPLNFHFSRSNLSGSYFLGKCHVTDSILYKTDIRGDELKRKGDFFATEGFTIPLQEDETIRVRDCFLIKTLVHNNSHDPEHPEEFIIQNTVSTHFANIHGSVVEGCFMGPFSTVDLTTVHDCVIGEYAYVQAGELSHRQVPAGTVWVKSGERFEFVFRHHPETLQRYVRFRPGSPPEGLFMEFIDRRKADYQRIFDVVKLQTPFSMPPGASFNRYAVIKPKTQIGRNVLVAQRAYIENSWLGDGANAQENCYILHSRLNGNNVTAHGAKIIHADLGPKVFVGFNSFLQGSADHRLAIGPGCIVMPHTIIDLEAAVHIPAEHLVWGYIRTPQDVAAHSLPLARLSALSGEETLGAMRFKGDGRLFVEGFKNRIEHILEANGAYCDGAAQRGHAQQSQDISFNLIQPYPEGELKGLYPTIDIHP
ncbi:MAG: transferase [Desulfobacterales bacterium]|jgi:carbonic anhydrase/acetyltransferase-like protein (isoleucine patch superfamily)|nr:transferase [Desulfobacterales bacterium]